MFGKNFVNKFTLVFLLLIFHQNSNIFINSLETVGFKLTFKEEPDNPPPPPLMPVAVPPPKKANVVQVTIYMEAQCPDTTGFIRRQLLPSWSRLSSTRRLNVTLVPFGKASCVAEEDDYKCDCQHGKDECELNQLMNCAIEHLPDPESHIPLIGCVQGKDNLIAAFRSCLNGHSSSDLLWTCSIGKLGRRLHALAGNKTISIGDSFNFVPWVVLDGQRENDAFYALEENLCKRIHDPVPKQCLKFL
ncbi:unnamed protein product [Meloidogyne enterolobii]|uniref:Uncharacterized protein n=1 Tax=Meloidogyne enterolobii TaxID=390850 RepID=A0ACB0YJX2_MELEN